MKKTALITGATGGIGSAVAARFHKKGFRLVLVDIDSAKLAAMAAQYPGAAVCQLDLRDNAAVAAFCTDVIESGEFIDIAVINAGMMLIGDFADTPRQSVVDLLQVNLVSAALLIQSFAARMALAGHGHIIATVSMGGIVAVKGSSVYSASKFGLRGLLWGIRDELSSKGVHVTGIFPAGVDTPMLRHEATSGGSALNFLGVPVSADDVAKAYEMALKQPRLEIYVPYADSIMGRVGGAFPWLMSKLYPLLTNRGEAGRRKYLKKIGAP